MVLVIPPMPKHDDQDTGTSQFTRNNFHYSADLVIDGPNGIALWFDTSAHTDNESTSVHISHSAQHKNSMYATSRVAIPKASA